MHGAYQTHVGLTINVFKNFQNLPTCDICMDICFVLTSEEALLKVSNSPLLFVFEAGGSNGEPADNGGADTSDRPLSLFTCGLLNSDVEGEA